MDNGITGGKNKIILNSLFNNSKQTGPDFHILGVLAPGSVHARPSARPPINTIGNFSGTHVCRVTFKHLPQPLRSHIRSFGTIGQLLKIPPFPPKNIIVWGEGGVGKFQKLSYGSETSDMTSEGLGEMFEGDSADMYAGKFPLMLMRG